MAIFNEAGTELIDSEITTIAGAGTTGPKVYQITQNVYEAKALPGSTKTVQHLLFYKDQFVSQAQLDRALAIAKDVATP